MSREPSPKCPKPVLGQDGVSGTLLQSSLNSTLDWSNSSVATAIASAAEPSVDGRLDGFGPTLQMEEMRRCQKAAIETTYKDWSRRRQELRSYSEKRRAARHIDSHKTTTRLAEDAWNHAASLSGMDVSRMNERISHDRGDSVRAEKLRSDMCHQSRSMRIDNENARHRAQQEYTMGIDRHNEIQATAAKKRREISNARAAAIEDITQQCRRQRSNGPGSPHSPRITFSSRSTGPASPHTPRAAFTRVGVQKAASERPTTR